MRYIETKTLSGQDFFIFQGDKVKFGCNADLVRSSISEGCGADVETIRQIIRSNKYLVGVENRAVTEEQARELYVAAVAVVNGE